MAKAYLATVIAIIVTTSIATHVLALRALGPAAPALLANLRSAAHGFSSQLGNFVNDRIAAALIRQAWQAREGGRTSASRGTSRWL